MNLIIDFQNMFSRSNNVKWWWASDSQLIRSRVQIRHAVLYFLFHAKLRHIHANAYNRCWCYDTAPARCVHLCCVTRRRILHVNLTESIILTWTKMQQKLCSRTANSAARGANAARIGGATISHNSFLLPSFLIYVYTSFLFTQKNLSSSISLPHLIFGLALVSALVKLIVTISSISIP